MRPWRLGLLFLTSETEQLDPRTVFGRKVQRVAALRHCEGEEGEWPTVDGTENGRAVDEDLDPVRSGRRDLSLDDEGTLERQDREAKKNGAEPDAVVAT